MIGVLDILIGLCLAAALIVALMRPKNNMEDPAVKTKDDRLKKITGVMLFCALAVLAVKMLSR